MDIETRISALVLTYLRDNCKSSAKLFSKKYDSLVASDGSQKLQDLIEIGVDINAKQLKETNNEQKINAMVLKYLNDKCESAAKLFNKKLKLSDSGDDLHDLEELVTIGINIHKRKSDDSDDNRKSKKLKTNDSLQTNAEFDTSFVANNSNTFTQSEPKRRSSPFRRIKAEEVNVLPQLQNNSFQGGRDEWGYKAAASFNKVKGKDFRREKTKKKRGSYSGGFISQEVNSIKFN